MTKEDVLQKVNDYCNEKSYTSETLTDSFKDKFADHFQKAYPDGDVGDEKILANLKFALSSAFSSASELATVKTAAFEAKERGYQSQIDELKKKADGRRKTEHEIPKEIQDKLDAYDRFMDAENKKNRFANIMEMAKNGIRQDLHVSFEKFAAGYDVNLDKDDKEQADALTKRFQEIFMDSIGDIKPLAPRQMQQRTEEIIASIPKIKVK